MLNYLLIQAGVAFLTFVFAVICINVWNCCKSMKGRIVSVVFGVLSIASATYYCLDVLLFNRYEWSNVKVKLLLFGVAVAFFILAIGCFWSDVKDKKMFTILTLTVTVVLILFALFAIINPIEKADKYNMNVIKQSPQVQTQEYELVAASDGTNIEGSLSGESSGSFFLISGTMSSTVNGEIKQTDVYKFYYVANSKTGEIRFMTVNANSTSIFYVEEGEEPYLLKKVITPYSLDYNVDPPQQCNVGKSTVTYELHIPKGSIVGFEFNNN